MRAAIRRAGFAMCFAALLWVPATKANAQAGRLPALDREAVVSAARSVLVAEQADGQTRTEWLEAIDAAEARRNSGKRIMIYGSLAALGATIIGIAAASADPVDGGRAGSAIMLTGMLGGGGVAAYGAYKLASAGQTLDELDREGRTRGFTSDGAAVKAPLGVTFSF